MNSTATAQKEKSELKFPCLMIQPKKNFIVLAISKGEDNHSFKGTIIYIDNNQHTNPHTFGDGHEFGEYCDAWNTDFFEKFDGIVTINGGENEE
jgi:hypothetical protein